MVGATLPRLRSEQIWVTRSIYLQDLYPPNDWPLAPARDAAQIRGLNLSSPPAGTSFNLIVIISIISSPNRPR